jgi:tight adherence protein B
MSGTRIAEAKKAALAYLHTVPANVKVGIVSFDSGVHTLLAPTTDRGAATTTIGSLKLALKTSLYDGVKAALLQTGTTGQRQVLVLSDGRDTTTSPLAATVATIKKSGVKVDVVSLQQTGAGAAPLAAMAQAGKGQINNALDPAALSAAFTSEADVLARQVLVSATVPSSVKGTSANVGVSIGAGTTTYTGAAYLQVRPSAAPTTGPTEQAGPIPVKASALALPQPVVFGAIGAIGLGLIGVLVAIGMRQPVPSAPQALRTQMGAYGVIAQERGASGKGATPANQSFTDTAKEAAAKALANNKSLEAKIAGRLEAAGMSLKPAEWLLLHGGLAFGIALVGLLLGGGNPILLLVFLLIGIIGPWFYLGMKRSRRLKAFDSGLADTLQLMAGSLSAGLSLAQSVDTIVREGAEPIASEFKRTIVESRLGVTLEDAMEGVAERMDSRDFQWVVMAIRIQREVGGNLAELLLSVADTLREREYLRRHVRALSAEGRLSCYVLGGLPPGFLLYLTVSKPSYVHPMYTTGIGYVLLGAMAVLLAVGIFWMSKVSKVDI